MSNQEIYVGDAAIANAGDGPAATTAAARAIVGVAGALNHLGGAGVVFLALATVYDVFARYLFNQPTTWATEISTYVLIAATFFGAAHTHLIDGHVRVEVLLHRLTGGARRTALLSAAWIAFLFAFITAWQSVLMVAADYRNNSRVFSLLLTPTWMPKLPIALGLAALAAAILVEIERLSELAAPWRRWLPYLLFTAVTMVLMAFGRDLPTLGSTRFDAGSLLVLLAVYVAAFSSGGWRVSLTLVLVTIGGAFCLLFGRSLGVGVVGTLLGASIALALAAGIRIAFALAFVGMLGVYFLTPIPFPLTLADRTWSSINSFSLTAVPMFVLMGAFLVRSGLSKELFAVMARLLARLPGGLAHAATVGCGLFAAVSGSSVATAATIGGVACPEMIRRGYSPALTYGTVAAGGTLGILIPPSVPMIIYGTAVGVPVSTLFIAGIMPGILMMLLFVATIFIWTWLDPQAAPAVDPKELQQISAQSLLDTGLLVILIVMIVATLYLGVATPSETGAVGAFLAFIICAMRGRLDLPAIKAAVSETVVVTSFIFLIVVGANIITFSFDYLKISQNLMEAATAANVNRWIVLLIIVGVYVVLGMFLDSISMLVLTLPVVFPLAKSLGFDAVWFGIILVIMAEVGLITPPVGMNLFVLQGISRGVTIRTIALGALPFLVAMFATVALLCISPDIALWLTRHLE